MRDRIDIAFVCGFPDYGANNSPLGSVHGEPFLGINYGQSFGRSRYHCGADCDPTYEAWGRANTTYFACFAAGVLISVSFLHVIPTALGMIAKAPVYLLSGYPADACGEPVSHRLCLRQARDR